MDEPFTIEKIRRKVAGEYIRSYEFCAQTLDFHGYSDAAEFLRNQAKELKETL